jgi:hypothetical protein
VIYCDGILKAARVYVGSLLEEHGASLVDVKFVGECWELAKS